MGLLGPRPNRLILVDLTGLEPVILGVKTSEVTLTSTGPWPGLTKNSPQLKSCLGSFGTPSVEAISYLTRLNLSYMI